jgi:hypothetical protein
VRDGGAATVISVAATRPKTLFVRPIAFIHDALLLSRYAVHGYACQVVAASGISARSVPLARTVTHPSQYPRPMIDLGNLQGLRAHDHQLAVRLDVDQRFGFRHHDQDMQARPPAVQQTDPGFTRARCG